jgi:SAM-dependent methyltransferase
MSAGEERVENPFFARMYLRLARRRGIAGEEEYRRELLAGLTGRVIEVGAGSGLNFPLYPEGVELVLAVEPEPRLRAAALEAARTAAVPVDVVDGVSGSLPAADASFDAGVASLVLCSVPDPARALAEFRRVIRPGGELRFYEHVVSLHRGARLAQRLADATLWPRLAGNCHMTRDTGKAIEAAGFQTLRIDRFSFSPGPPAPAIPHILGSARRR